MTRRRSWSGGEHCNPVGGVAPPDSSRGPGSPRPSSYPAAPVPAASRPGICVKMDLQDSEDKAGSLEALGTVTSARRRHCLPTPPSPLQSGLLLSARLRAPGVDVQGHWRARSPTRKGTLHGLSEFRGSLVKSDPRKQRPALANRAHEGPILRPSRIHLESAHQGQATLQT